MSAEEAMTPDEPSADSVEKARTLLDEMSLYPPEEARLGLKGEHDDDAYSIARALDAARREGQIEGATWALEYAKSETRRALLDMMKATEADAILGALPPSAETAAEIVSDHRARGRTR